jgi:hypothetical protein
MACSELLRVNVAPWGINDRSGNIVGYDRSGNVVGYDRSGNIVGYDRSGNIVLCSEYDDGPHQ